jgi:nickel-dependent lactate racemase
MRTYVKINLKYGESQKHLVFPQKASVSVLSPSTLPVLENLEEAFEEAMDSPLGGQRLETMDGPRRVAIAVPDETRPAPVKTLLPLLLIRLYESFPNLRPEHVTIVIASGLHPPLDEQGIRRVVPDSVAPGCKVVSHDAVYSRMTDYGMTHLKTPVLINADFAEADLRLVIGNIDPHQFVGFTGGAKGAVIGCASKNTIEANHALMFNKKARVANMEGNPVRSDIDEAGRLAGIPLVINLVLDGSNRVVKLLAGDPVRVFREGAKTCAAVYGVAIREKFDIAVASCGGHPKDINLYQAQKGLAHAAQAVKPGGKILLMAACPQGVGSEVYYEYVSGFSTPKAVLEDFRRRGFKMGAHKAFLFGRTLATFDVAIASDLEPEVLSNCHLKACDAQETIERWVECFPGVPAMAVIPNANTTYFYTQ